MDRQRNEWTDRRVNRLTLGQTYKCTDGKMEIKTNCDIDRWIDK